MASVNELSGKVAGIRRLGELDDVKVYRYFTGKDDAAFCHRVTHALNNGWKLYGQPTSRRQELAIALHDDASVLLVPGDRAGKHHTVDGSGNPVQSLTPMSDRQCPWCSIKGAVR